MTKYTGPIKEVKLVEKEIWMPVKGYEGIYEVSNRGRVNSLPRRKGNVVVINRKIKRSYLNDRGYPVVGLFKDDKRKTCTVHRLVAQAFIQNPENKPQVNHIDGDKTNNILSNLEWATREENTKHAYDIGLNHGANAYGNSQGEEHFMARLSEENVQFIRENSKKNGGDMMNIELAAMFGVHKTTIGMVVNGQNWSHLPFPKEPSNAHHR